MNSIYKNNKNFIVSDPWLTDDINSFTQDIRTLAEIIVKLGLTKAIKSF